MNIDLKQKPKKRSRFRLFLGKTFYRFKRYLDWYFSSKDYAYSISFDKLPFEVFTHKTPLIRKLQGVDLKLQYNKVKNLSIAVKKLNGVIIKPGQTFSYWKLIGKPTYRKGYLKGLVLNYNGTFTEGIGGGLCQLSNLIYWMTLHTPLTVTERYRHSHDVFPDSNRTQPFGSGATCSYNYLDLQIFNNTDNEFQLMVYMTDDYLVGEWRASSEIGTQYEVHEKEHIIEHTFWGGYIRHNKLYRRVYNSMNEVINDEYITENHALMMYQPFLEEPECCNEVNKNNVNI